MSDFLKDFGREFSERVSPTQRQDRLSAEERARQDALLENKKNELLKTKMNEEDPNSLENKQYQDALSGALETTARSLQLPLKKEDFIPLTSKVRKIDSKDLNPMDMLKAAAMLKSEKEKPQKAAPVDPFNKKMDTDQAQGFVKEINALPDITNRVKNLDNITKIADKVLTGPLAGRDNIFLAQKITKDDAQRLEQFLSQENVKLMMEYAKQAGVRSVDTEQEQQRLFKSIANKELSPVVLKETVARMKNMMNQAMQLTRAKQEHYAKNGNLRSFSPDRVLGAPAQKEPIIRVGPDGKRYAFDPDTKQNLGEVK